MLIKFLKLIINRLNLNSLILIIFLKNKIKIKIKNNINNFLITQKQSKFLIKLFFLFFNFFKKYHIFYSFFIEKKILFNKHYTQFLNKNNFLFNMSMLNFLNKNFFFFKDFNKFYFKKKISFKRPKKNKRKRKITKKKLFLFKNNINFNNFFFNNFFFNCFKNFRFFKTKKNITTTKIFYTNFQNLVFCKKNKNTFFCKSEYSFLYFNLVSIKNKIFINYFFRDFIFNSFYLNRKNIKKKKKIFFKKISFSNKINSLRVLKTLFKKKSFKKIKPNLIIFPATNFFPLNISILRSFSIILLKFNFLFFYKFFSFFILKKNIKKINLFQKKIKFHKFKKNFKKIIKNIIFVNNFYINNNLILKRSFSLTSNSYFFKNLKILDNIILNSKYQKNSFLNIYYNNYYPILYANKKSSKTFLSKFRAGLNANFLIYMNFYIVSFLEKFFKKKIFLKISNNFFKKPENIGFLKNIFNSYKNYQPKYMKKFLIKDFIEILWISFYLKDLNIISDWFQKFMESVNFRVHKKFITFFNNFVKKYYKTFLKLLKIKGFFFDIRGKVGVTGNSKKRHFFFKVGQLNRSAKFRKLNFKQTVIRTPSGALGVSMMLNY